MKELELDHLKSELEKIAFVLSDFEIKDGFLVLPIYSKVFPFWHQLYSGSVEDIENKTYAIMASMNRVIDKDLSQEQSEQQLIQDLKSITVDELKKFDFKDDVELNLTEEEKEKLTKLLGMLIGAQIALIMNYMSSMVYGVSLNEVLFSKKTPSDRQLASAVRIDKSLISHKLLVSRISEAQLTGDKVFLNIIGNAIQKPNFHTRASYPFVYFAFYVLEREKQIVDGKLVKPLTFKILLNLLEDCGFFTEDRRIPSEKQLQKVLATYHRNKRNPF